VQGRHGDVIVTKADLGLQNVDNTSDANKPVSMAQAAAIDTRVRHDAAQGLGNAAKQRARQNIGAVMPQVERLLVSALNTLPDLAQVAHDAKTVTLEYGGVTFVSDALDADDGAFTVDVNNRTLTWKPAKGGPLDPSAVDGNLKLTARYFSEV
jgi:hypothetical protein